MAVTRINIETLLALYGQYPIIDVRSEGEYNHAHFPGAFSLPLFNNEERKEVGTIYKQQSKQHAIKAGLQIIGKKLLKIVEEVEAILEADDKQTAETTPKTIIVHCWRGGMRSGGVAWLLDLYGFKVYTVAGGYKAYRKWVLEQFKRDFPIKVVGGYTGSGKTFVLQELAKSGAAVIDLEMIASHKGSAFGSIHMEPQPTQEMFENILALELVKAEQCILDARGGEEDGMNGKIQNGNDKEQNFKSFIWLEDESQRIGRINIPTEFYETIRQKPVYFIEIPLEERLQHILADYGKGNKDDLIQAVLRIQKRLGGLETKLAVENIENGNLAESAKILLTYYDKEYLKGLHKRERLNDLLYKIECYAVDPKENAQRIIEKH